MPQLSTAGTKITKASDITIDIGNTREFVGIKFSRPVEMLALTPDDAEALGKRLIEGAAKVRAIPRP